METKYGSAGIKNKLYLYYFMLCHCLIALSIIIDWLFIINTTSGFIIAFCSIIVILLIDFFFII